MSASPLWAVPLGLWFWLLALALGEALMRRLEPEMGGVLRFANATLLGLGVLAYWVLATGWLGWSSGLIYGELGILTLIVALVGRRSGWHAPYATLLASGKSVYAQLTRLERVLLFLILLILALATITAFSPGIGWDATSHHYVPAEIYLREGRVVPTPEIIFGNYPGIAQNLFAWAFALQGEALAGLFCVGFTGLVALLLYGFGRELHSRSAGLFAALAFLTNTTVSWLMASGYIDLLETAFVLGGLTAWMHALREEGRTRPPWLAGWLLGCAVGTKHLGWLYLIALLAGRLWVAWRGGVGERGAQPLRRELPVVVGVCVLCGLPWFVRAYLNSGNPIDPFLPALFQPEQIPTNAVSFRSWSKPTLERGLLALLSYPWRFFNGISFVGGWFRALSPIYLAMLPLPLLLRHARLRQPVGMLVVPILAYFAVAFVLAPTNTRYALPLVALASLVVGMIASELALQLLWRLRLLPLLIGLPALVMLGLLGKEVALNARYWMGQVDREAMRETYFEGYHAIAWANANLPDEAMILSTDPRAYFFERATIIAWPGSESHLAPSWTLNNTGELLDKWKALGITHLFVNDTKLLVPEGYYLYGLLHEVESRGIAVQTAEQGAEWSDGILNAEEAWRFAEISRVPLLPNADGRGNPAAVVMPEWISAVIGTNRLPLMQGHLQAMAPLLEPLYAQERMRVYRIKWEEYARGVEPEHARTLKYLMQGFPMPEEIRRAGEARYRELEPRLVEQ